MQAIERAIRIVAWPSQMVVLGSSATFLYFAGVLVPWNDGVVDAGKERASEGKEEQCVHNQRWPQSAQIMAHIRSWYPSLQRASFLAPRQKHYGDRKALW